MLRPVAEILQVAVLSGTLAALAQTGAQDRRENQVRTWTGALIDAECTQSDKKADCIVTNRTRFFSLVTTEGTFRLDARGNQAAAAAIRSKYRKEGEVRAEVKGLLEGDVLRAESVRVLDQA